MRAFTLIAPALLAIPAGALQPQHPYPGAEWPRATPAAMGMNAAVLDSIHDEITRGQYGLVDRFLAIRRGHVVYDRVYAQDYDRAYGAQARTKSGLNGHDVGSQYNYYNPWWHPTYRRGDLHTLQSVTKTITSVVIGTAVTRGGFPALDTPVFAILDTAGVAHLDERKRRLTIRHLLTMTDGMDWNESLPYTDPRNAAIAMETSYDWIDFVLDRPIAREPGAGFNYNSGASQLLAHLFRVATGVDIEEYAARHLFAPLGITRWYWKRSPAGVVDTEGGLYLEARDLARIWYLFLRNGEWNGARVLSPEWVRQSVTPAVTLRGVQYGLKWWLHPDPRDSTQLVWVGSGFGGQHPMAFPRDDMIVVFNGWNIGGGPSLPTRRMMTRLVGALR